MTSDQKRWYWKKNWNYGMSEEECTRYLKKVVTRKEKHVAKQQR